MKKIILLSLLLISLVLIGCAEKELTEEELAISDNESGVIIEEAQGAETRALVGQGISSGLVNSGVSPELAACRARWKDLLASKLPDKKVLAKIKEAECSKLECIDNFKKTNPVYLQVNSVFPGENKMRAYLSTSPPAGLSLPTNYDNTITSKTKRQVVVRNDLTGEDIFFSRNTAVRVISGINGAIPTDSEAGVNNLCVNGVTDNSDMVVPSGKSAYTISSSFRGNYRFQVKMGSFGINPFTIGLISCDLGTTVNLDDYVAEEEFGDEVFDSGTVTLSCDNLMSTECSYWRHYQPVIFCDGRQYLEETYLDVSDHCAGMTLDIKLSGFLPSGNDYRTESPLCSVYGYS